MPFSEIEQRYEDFFQLPLHNLGMDHELFSVEKGGGGRWHGFSTGFSGVLYRIAFLQGEKPAVRIVIDLSDREWNHRLFHRLSGRRDAIEAHLSHPLEWDCVEGRRRCIVSVVREGSIADPRETWPELQQWMIEWLLAFKRVFTPHLQELVE
ncbi:MAG: DUF4268 domain-containing protein [Chloroflexi bacterium]|nr:DUF4268 domain-containing protein [Chloroflexota bacterium]